MTDQAQRELDRAFDPEHFRREGHALVDAIAEHLSAAVAAEGPVLAGRTPEDLAVWLDEAETDDLASFLGAVGESSNRLHHPGYIGHQVATVMPEAALVEAFNALLNNGMAVYEMGQVQTVAERAVLRTLARWIGFDLEGGQPDGVLTHGGSIGNLTALLAARQAKAAGEDVWQDGMREPLAVLVSEQAHYCIQRAVQVMGCGAAGAVPVETDEAYRMRTDRLEAAYERAHAAGRRVIAVVASSCTTSTGSFDDLERVAEFCAARQLWMHVDGAHGASLLLSGRYRECLRGIERADSVVWDLHKLMMLPALSTAVVFRDGRAGAGAFAQRAAYLFADGDEGDHDVGKRTLECTKRAMGLTAWTMLRRFGAATFEAFVDRVIDRAQDFARCVVAADDFELAVEPACNIVCFRIRPAGLEGAELNRHQERVRAAVLDAGRYYIVSTRLRDEAVWLRITVMNPATTPEVLAALLDEVRLHSRRFCG